MRRCRFLIAIVLMFLVLVSLEAQTRKNLAILPFTGVTAQEGDNISIVFASSAGGILREYFDLLPRNSAMSELTKDLNYQRDSGLINTAAISQAGQMLAADMVVLGNITNLGNEKLVLLLIIDVKEVQLIAGAYATYKNDTEVRGKFSEMARKLVEVSRNNVNKKMQGLAIPSFSSIGAGVRERDAIVLSQILSIEIANSGKYAVLPRNDQTQQAILEESKAQRSGLVTGARVIGSTQSIDFLLSCFIIGNTLGENSFNALMLTYENKQVNEDLQIYKDIADGLTKNLMRQMAEKLTGVKLSSVSSTTQQPTTPAPAPQPSPAPAAYTGEIISTTAGWETSNGLNGHSRMSIGKERIDNRERDVLTITVNIGAQAKATGSGFILHSSAGIRLYNNTNVIQKLKNANGIRFKALGDGKKWIVSFVTGNDFLDTNHVITISTQNRRTVSIDIPYNKLLYCPR